MNNEIHITNRELEVLEHIAQGFTMIQIADLLFVSMETIKSHRKNLFGKLNARNGAQAVMIAFKSGIFGLEAMVSAA